MLKSAEKRDPVDPVDTQRDNSGHAPIAGVGEPEGVGDGESRRKDGCSRSSR
jgi:hypothetical protein